MFSFAPVLIIIAICLYVITGTMRSMKNNNPRTSRPANPQNPRNSQPQAETDPEPQPLELPEEGPVVRERPLEPTVRFTGRDETVYQGSLNAVTGEGEDPCHDEQLSALNHAKDRIAVSPDPEAAILPGSEPQPGFTLRWNGDEVVRGLVMSEILKRKSFR